MGGVKVGDELAERARSSPEPLLAVRGLTVRFGPYLALDRVNLDVGAGEIVVLAGENGAGKSTLVQAIGGDIPRSAGEISIEGYPSGGDPAAIARQGVAIVWQDLALCDNLDVAANLLLGRESRKLLLSEPRFHAAAQSVLADLGIPIRDTHRTVRLLTGGQRQMLAVASAMQDQPRLLVLDEPSATLGINETAEVERLILEVRAKGTAVLMTCHDAEQMFRLADRIVVLRNGRVVESGRANDLHPDDVVALMAGQEVDSSARGQLTRLHGLVDQLSSADRSSTLPLVLSTLGAALGTQRLCIHVVDGAALQCVASFGLPATLAAAWSSLSFGAPGGPVGLAAESESVVLVDNVRSSPQWSPFRSILDTLDVSSSWTIPITDSTGLVGLLTVLRRSPGKPRRDELDLMTLYAGYVASALDRERLFSEVTTRNGVLETIRDVLETLAGPVPVERSLVVAMRALCAGLQADEVALICKLGADVVCRAATNASASSDDDRPSGETMAAARYVFETNRLGVIHQLYEDRRSHDEGQGHGGLQGQIAISFTSPSGTAALVARWGEKPVPREAIALMSDAAHSLRLALEREEAGHVHQEAAALRRSHELQREFLSRLSHELRTPLTAIRGYASSLLQTDVTWDGDSEHRFLTRIAAESARLGRLVGDLLDFSAIESGVLRLHPDWCDIPLVLDAARALLPPRAAAAVEVSCQAGLPVVWADHDRLEQVFLNLMDNAVRHNPPGTPVFVSAEVAASHVGHDVLNGGSPSSTVMSITVADAGVGMPAELAELPFGPVQRRSSPTAGTGLGLSIARAIVDAHGGQMSLVPSAVGSRFVVRLPVESVSKPSEETVDA